MYMEVLWKFILVYVFLRFLNLFLSVMVRKVDVYNWVVVTRLSMVSSWVGSVQVTIVIPLFVSTTN